MAKKGGDVIFRLLGDNNHLAKSHANFTAGDDMVQAHNRKIALAPGV